MEPRNGLLRVCPHEGAVVLVQLITSHMSFSIVLVNML